jgi:hypothetical protein
MLKAPWQKLHMPRELACEFLGIFSRFEYALKAGGFAKSSRHGYAEPDWTTFGQSIAANFNSAATPELDASVAYLVANPPLRQSYSAAAGLSWSAVPVAAGVSQAERLIAYVRCVRNNLFHGGKFLAQPVGSSDRDFKLVTCSLVVLGGLVTLNSNVEQAYST